MSEKRDLPIDVAITCPSGLSMNRRQPETTQKRVLKEKRHSQMFTQVKLVFRRTIGLDRIAFA